MVEQGRKVRITSILCGRGLRHRLCDISLYEGAVVEVIRNDAAGPVILKVLDSRVVIGRGQANKIMVNFI
ncbi:MAG: FeoA family protein [Candidatus Altiarchaeota archaeon]|nr:FeoA family protein [Candidatus Altiarchaeota archaeon]